MSLRDYLLTRMSLRQDARQRELDIEQARASRQAAEQAAYMQYGNAALQAAVQGAGKFAGAMSEADAAQKALEAEAIQASAASRALEGANAPVVGGMPVEDSAETVGTIAPYQMPKFGFFKEGESPLAAPGTPPAVIAPDASQVVSATDAATEAEMRHLMLNEDLDKQSQARGFANQATEMGLTRTPAQAEAAAIKAADAADLAYSLKQENQNKGADTTASVTRSGTATAADTTLVAQPDFVYKAPSTPVSSAQTPAASPVAVSRVPITEKSKISKLDAAQKETEANVAAAKALADKIAASPAPPTDMTVAPPTAAMRTAAPVGGAPVGGEFVEPSAVDQGTSDILRKTLQRMRTEDVQEVATPAAYKAAIASPAAVLPADTKMAAVPAEVQRAAQGPSGEALAPKVSDVMPIPGMGGGLSIPNPQAILARSTPEEDKVYTKAISDDLDKQIADLKLRTGLDINKPTVAKSIEQASKVTGYTPPVYTKTARELAKEVTDQVWKTRPPGNPLTALFMRDNSALNKQIAEDKAFLIISGARTKHSAEHLDNFVKLEEMRTKQIMDKRRMDLMESQALLNTSKSDKAIRFKTDLPSPERSKMQGFDLAQRSLSNLTERTREALVEGKGLPLGTDRSMADAYVKLNASKQGSDSASISAGAGVLGGASLSISQAKSGKPLDEKLLLDAFNTVDQSGWTPTQKMMHMQKYQTIQNLGKALEGGKLTDADYVKYVQILINSSDPQTYLMSLNNLMKDSFANYSTYKTNLSGTYEPSALVGFEPVNPEAFYFNKEEIDSAFAAPIGAAAARVAETGRNYRGPGTSVNPLVSGAAGTIQALMAKLATLNPNSPDANAIKAEIARLQAEAAGGAGAVEGNPAGNPLND